MSSPPNITTITPPRVPLVDPRTGIIAREWYRFFLNLFTLTYEGTGGSSDDFALAPLPVDYSDVIDTAINGLEVAPAPVDYTAEINAVKRNAEIGTTPPVIFGTLAYQNSENAFVTRLNTVSATTGVRNGTLAEDSAFVTLLGTNGVITGIGTTAVTVTQATGFRPFASNTYNLGTSGQRWASTYSTEFLAGAGQQARFKEDSGFAVVDGDNGVTTGIAGTPVTVTQATGFRPFASNTYNLGTSGQRWASTYSTEFLAGAAQQARFKEDTAYAVVDGDNGVLMRYAGTTITVTQASGFRPAFSYSYNLGTSSQRWYSVYAQEFLAGDSQQARFKENSGFAVVDGDSGVTTGIGGSVVTVTQSSGFRPNVSYSYNLGTSSQRWYSVYAQEFLAGDSQQAQYKESSGYAFVNGSNGVLTAYSSSIITQVDSSGLRPYSSSSYSLGTSSYYWTGVYGTTFYAGNTTTKFYQDTNFAVVTGSNGVITAIGTTAITVTQATGFRPNVDNTYNLGTSGQRWNTVYASVGTINTSDGNEKQQIQELTDVERRVAQRLKTLVRTFKWNSAVALKGDAARTHVGVIAQDVRAAFAAEGLDAHKYGMFCSDDIESADGTATTRLGVRYDQLLAFVLATL